MNGRLTKNLATSSHTHLAEACAPETEGQHPGQASKRSLMPIGPTSKHPNKHVPTALRKCGVE